MKRWLIYGCGHRLAVEFGITLRRPRCPRCRARHESRDERARRRDEAERRAAAVAFAHRIAALVGWARRRDEDLPLAMWAGGGR